MAEGEVAARTLARAELGAFTPQELRRSSVLVTCLALLNNAPFCVVLAAAQHLLSSVLGFKGLSPIITLGCVAAALVGSAGNAWLIAAGTTLERRMDLVCVLNGASSVALTTATLLSPIPGLVATIVGVIAIGLGQAVGETSLVADLRFLAPALGMWGLGTGLAGLVGPLLYVALAALGAPDTLVFAATLAVPLAFRHVYGQLHTLVRAAAGTQLVGEDDDGHTLASEAADAQDGVGEVLMQPTLARVLWHIGFLAANLVAVYSLEYEIYPGLVDVATRSTPNPSSALQRHAYPLAWACYNVGVTVSRLSVNFVRIRQVGLLSAAQALNFALWFCEARAHWLRNMGDDGYALMLLWMVWVGCMGGASYSNCCYRINHDEGIPKDVRNVGIPVAFGLVNVGIMIATATGLYLNCTILRDE